MPVFSVKNEKLTTLIFCLFFCRARAFKFLYPSLPPYRTVPKCPLFRPTVQTIILPIIMRAYIIL